jgi:hypothetical protein
MIYLNFPYSDVISTTSVNWVVPYQNNCLFDFNIGNYPGVDSVAFGAYISVLSYSTNRCYVQLYDLTNNTAIANSQIITGAVDLPTWVSTTVNFKKDLPQSKIKLGISIKSKYDGLGANCINPVLFLYRK